MSMISPLSSSVSIHAAREGGDQRVSPCSRKAHQFQSTPPVKAATFTGVQNLIYTVFQSTPPVKAATLRSYAKRISECVSIHAAREGGDLIHALNKVVMLSFNPRRP